MVDLIVGVVASVLEWLVRCFLHLTGECLRWLLTLGRRRVRWWDPDDDVVAWPSIALGIAFWAGAGVLAWLALR